MNKTDIYNSIEACMNWIKNHMASFNHASWGIYERIRIDENQRVCWVRPDCNSELLNTLELYERVYAKNKEPYYTNILHWLKNVQNTDSDKKGSFNFYFLDGKYADGAAPALFQNDNGKVLYHLGQIYNRTQQNEILTMMRDLADFWIPCQTEEGYFYDKNYKTMHCYAKGPCFVVWMMMGLYQIWDITKDERYYNTANRALRYCLCSLILEDRIRTSYELEKFEDWRPYSSEAAILLLGLSEAYQKEHDTLLKECIGHKRKILTDLLLDMQHKSGAILNCGHMSVEGLTLQTNASSADLVYTEGFALRALIRAYEVFGDSEYLDASVRLAQFLISIQCKNESPYWDGAWRGSYDVNQQCWAGRCNQNNEIDEGGMYSVYTGWCCTNIMLGLLNLEPYINT